MTTKTTGYAEIHGLHLYYEIHGSGEPLILLHGGLGSVEMFGPNIEMLAKTHQVIAVDLQGHGRTADIDRPMSYEAMGDDVAALIQHLGFERADVMGYSLGGGVALQAAIRHPARVRRLVIVSTVFARSGWFPEVRAGFDAFGPQLAAMMKQGPAYAFYASIAPRPQDFERVVEKLGTMLKKDYDWTALVTDKLPPTLIVAADADAIRPAHLVEMFAKLGGGQRDPGWDGSGGRSKSQLAILPGRTHYDIVASPALAAAVEPFLR
ncbi:MAG TPA: alpha/beta hydrolase [Kofleriaceae bacterium]|nr:alpha/beta hydrolase [Kofleriaceae bacterium]